MGNGVLAVVDNLERTAAVEAAVQELDAAAESQKARMVFVGDGATETGLRAVVAWQTPAPLLADVCSLFEDFGLTVADHRALSSEQPHGVSLFHFVRPDALPPGSLHKVASAFGARERHGFVVDDFARLILTANVGWRDVTLVRSATRFLRQAGLRMSTRYVVDTLSAQADFVSALVRYFTARFAPDVPDRGVVVSSVHEQLVNLIEDCTSIDEDRIFRGLASFVTAVLRTNWFQLDPGGSAKRYSAFLLDSALLEPRGSQVPFREIFVDSEDIEGLHARSGPIARGGIRFSDRPEDYRTEVLGLMKTQTVKNSPVVPDGAKGAFVRKNPAISAEQAYRVFISGLLDVTDDLVDGQPSRDGGAVSYAEDNTYLVVAADKGTARFSDVANDIAVGRRFWLGDAFASGGSTGFDHKAMGITARGAWVSVRNHFDELDIDLDSRTITVAGIGDMSGDVFGNGMLLSANLKLIAAFDHRHVFIDPDPDPASSFAERERLSRQQTSSWDDYDRSVMSTGGGVWSRTSKSILLPRAARELLGLTAPSSTPNEVIRAVLKADVDLLWNGGIGTYVKSAREAHSVASDPANDTIRIDADELRATVIGEGGNLGFTQQARVDFALAGGRINADFIDNAAGVATSDREVNLKIALDDALRSGRITEPNRRRLLAGCKEEIARAVLTGCENQVLAISVAEGQAAELLSRHERLIDNLEQVSGISRASEILPTRKELVMRTRDGRGLTRPEIALLMAHSKNVVRDELLNSDVPDDPIFQVTLDEYFPSRFRHVVPEGITSHILAREIIATSLADDMVNHVGPGLVYQLDERLGVPTASVAAAYTVVRQLFDIDSMWVAAGGSAGTRSRDWLELRKVQHFIEHSTARLLHHHKSKPNIGATVAQYRADIDSLATRLGSASAEWQRIRFESFDLCHSASDLGVDVVHVARCFLAIQEELRLDWITERLAARTASHWWDAMGAAATRDQLIDTFHRLTTAILKFDPDPATAIDIWKRGAAPEITRYMHMRAELGQDNLVDVARAVTINAELTMLCRYTEARL